jgi:hypothetical protein
VWDSNSNPHLKHDLLCSGIPCWNDIQSSIHGLTLWCFQAAVIPFSIQVLSDPVVVSLVREAVCANLIVRTKNSVSPWTAVQYVWPRPVGSCFDTVAGVAMELGTLTELSCFAGRWIVWQYLRRSKLSRQRLFCYIGAMHVQHDGNLTPTTC